LSSSTASTKPDTKGLENYANALEMQEVCQGDHLNELTKAAPSVSRGLKPGRSISSGAATIGVCRTNGISHTSSGPPVERALKPKSPSTAFF